MLATSLICGRLIFVRYQLRTAFGGECATAYTSIVAMIIESEALYSIYLIIFIVPLILKTTLISVFSQGVATVQVGPLSYLFNFERQLIFASM